MSSIKDVINNIKQAESQRRLDKPTYLTWGDRASQSTFTIKFEGIGKAVVGWENKYPGRTPAPVVKSLTLYKRQTRRVLHPGIVMDAGPHKGKVVTVTGSLEHELRRAARELIDNGRT